MRALLETLRELDRAVKRGELAETALMAERLAAKAS
jgi:primosomal protein N''